MDDIDCDFLYNSEAREKVQKWLEVAPSLLSWGPACILWLVGPSGIGKASLIKAWAKKHDWELSLLSADNLHNAKDIIDQMAKIVNTQSFASAFQGKQLTRAILIDDIEIFASIDRGFFGAFTNCFKYSHWRPAPCICIVSQQLEKRVRDIRKGTVISMPAPATEEIRHWATNPKTEANYYDECNGNMSYLKFLLENGTPGQVIDRNIGAEAFFVEPIVPKSVLRRVVLEDPWFNPMRFHENCIAEMAKRKGNAKVKLANYAKIIDIFMDWDVIIGPSGGSVSSHHASGTTDIATELIIIAARKYLTPNKSLKSRSSFMSFTKMLSHLSLQKKHRREQYHHKPFGFPCPIFLSTF